MIEDAKTSGRLRKRYARLGLEPTPERMKMAIRFGVKALILAIIAVAIAGFLGISFIPTFSVSSIYDYIYSYITTAHFGALTLTGTVIAFVIGLIVGLLGFAKK